MESLPNVLIAKLLSHVKNARAVAICTSLSRQWKESVPYIKCLCFIEAYWRQDYITYSKNLDKMILSTVQLEELIVYYPFSYEESLASWLRHTAQSLKHLELIFEFLREVDCISVLKNLESLKLRSVELTQCPNWGVFQKLRYLEIVFGWFTDLAFDGILKACPNLTHMWITCSGGTSRVNIESPHLQHCKFEFYNSINSSIFISCPKLEVLEVEGCSFIRVKETKILRRLSFINNFEGSVEMLQYASEVKHLHMDVDFEENFPEITFPEFDFVKFFGSHPRLQIFYIHGSMFDDFCNNNNLENVHARFVIPCLEEVTIAIYYIESWIDAEKKMNTLNAILRHGRNLKKMVINIFELQSNCDDNPSYDFIEEIYNFGFMNNKIVQIDFIAAISDDLFS